MGAAIPAHPLGPSLPREPSPPCPLPGTRVPQPPSVEAPQGAHAQWEAGCQHGAVELSPGTWHRAGPAVGRGASLQGAEGNRLRARCLWNAPQPRLGCATLLGHRPPLSQGPRVQLCPGLPRDTGVVPGGTNNSWTTNNLTRWSVGGEPSWGASLAALPGPASPCPQHQPAAGWGRAPAGQRHGVAPVAEPPCPQRRSCGPLQTLPGQTAPLPASSPEGRGQRGGGQGRL